MPLSLPSSTGDSSNGPRPNDLLLCRCRTPSFRWVRTPGHWSGQHVVEVRTTPSPSIFPARVSCAKVRKCARITSLTSSIVTLLLYPGLLSSRALRMRTGARGRAIACALRSVPLFPSFPFVSLPQSTRVSLHGTLSPSCCISQGPRESRQSCSHSWRPRNLALDSWIRSFPPVRPFPFSRFSFFEALSPFLPSVSTLVGFAPPAHVLSSSLRNPNPLRALRQLSAHAHAKPCASLHDSVIIRGRRSERCVGAWKVTCPISSSVSSLDTEGEKTMEEPVTPFRCIQTTTLSVLPTTNSYGIVLNFLSRSLVPNCPCCNLESGSYFGVELIKP